MKNLNNRLLLITLFLVIAALLRLIPHPPNFVPITAIAIFSGAKFTNIKYALSIPLIIMLISDIFIGFYTISLFVYLAFIIISALVSEEFFQAWGWRIPFLSSVILIGISMYVQLHVEDTDAFKELEALREKRLTESQANNEPIRRSPVLEAIAKYPKRIMLAAGAFISVQVNFYILISFILAYGSDVNGGGMTRNTVLVAVLIASALQIVAQFWASAYSDRHGRRGVFMLGAALTGVAAFALFPLVSTGNFWLSVLGISMGLCFLGMMYGPQAAFFTELFSTEVRYSGASLGYQLGAIIGGAFAPTIATILWAEYSIVWVSAYMALASLISIISVGFLAETFKTSLTGKD